MKLPETVTATCKTWEFSITIHTGILALATDYFFRSRLDQMIDLRHPLAVLANHIPLQKIENALAPMFARKERSGTAVEVTDLFGQRVIPRANRGGQN
ncbi:MAG: hypothetical protein H7A12_02400 [Pseudomonadales bacterium]|nr:hypothetical protein [Pseudomonadales bacterium]